ncbi:MAG TPA: energy transducer TonB, partial [Bryobacteraceae bacterium]
KQQDPGPIRDSSGRAALRSQWWSTLEDGIWNLNRALEINPQYDDAMAYMNLFVRERADLRDTKTEYRQNIATADQWVRKALETKKLKANQRFTGPRGMIAAPPPPPPPPPPSGAAGAAGIHLAAAAQQAKLMRQVPPVYPPLAVQARVQGTVRFTATIDKEGRVANLQVVIGHSLLIPAALDAVKQWVYQPTLLNGNPVDVITQIDVNFALPDGPA